MEPTINVFLEAARDYGVWPIVVLFLGWKLGPLFADAIKSGWAEYAASQNKVAEALGALGDRVIDRIDRQSEVIAQNTAATSALTAVMRNGSRPSSSS